MANVPNIPDYILKAQTPYYSPTEKGVRFPQENEQSLLDDNAVHSKLALHDKRVESPLPSRLSRFTEPKSARIGVITPDFSKQAEEILKHGTTKEDYERERNEIFGLLQN